MTDVHTPAQRSRNMRAIGSKNTKPELRVRQLLHSAGYRFRLHAKQLPGRPDLILPKYRIAVFVHGCFWHGHGCHLFKLPATRAEFWAEKIGINRARDAAKENELVAKNWRVLYIWECATKGPRRMTDEQIISTFRCWLSSDAVTGTIGTAVLSAV